MSQVPPRGGGGGGGDFLYDFLVATYMQFQEIRGKWAT